MELFTFEAFRLSIAPLHRLIAQANPHLCKIVEDMKLARGSTYYNLHGSVCSFVMQEYEIRILEQIYIYCCENNFVENGQCSLCADGIMIERKKYIPRLLSDLQEHILDAIGFKLIFTQKPMTMGVNDIIDQHLNFDLVSPAFTSGLLADYFSVIYSQFVSKDGEVFEYNGVYWQSMDKKNAALHNFY
jgi:hypothetical protein